MQGKPYWYIWFIREDFTQCHPESLPVMVYSSSCYTQIEHHVAYSYMNQECSIFNINDIEVYR